MTLDSFLQSFLAALVALTIIVAIIGLIYSIVTRKGMKKKQSYFAELHQQLAPGKEIMFCGGIFGTVKNVNGDRVKVKVADGTVLEISRYSIQEIVSAS